MSGLQDRSYFKDILEGNKEYDELSKLSQFTASLMDVTRQLSKDAFFQIVLKYVEEGDYKEAFRCAFSLKEQASREEEPRSLIFHVTTQFVDKEKDFLTGQELNILCEEIRMQYSFMRIQGFRATITTKYSGLMNYLDTLTTKRESNIKESKHKELFRYLEDLFPRSNSDEEAWDRVAEKIIKSKIYSS